MKFLYKEFRNFEGIALFFVRNDNWSIPVDPANTDYQQFKQAINDGTAQLEDADGKLLTPTEAKAYVATLPANEGTK